MLALFFSLVIVSRQRREQLEQDGADGRVMIDGFSSAC